jgi:hypothetical protein
MSDQSRTKRAAAEFRPPWQCNDTRRCQSMGERQIRELIFLGAPLPGILNKLCMMINLRIGNVVSIISLLDEDQNHFCSITQSAQQVGLDVFSLDAILSREHALLGTLEIYGCDPRRPTPRESHLIQRALDLAAIALQRHEGEDGFGGSAIKPKDRVGRPIPKPAVHQLNQRARSYKHSGNENTGTGLAAQPCTINFLHCVKTPSTSIRIPATCF